MRGVVGVVLRPVAHGGLVHNTITGVANYPVHKDVLKSQLSGKS